MKEQRTIYCEGPDCEVNVSTATPLPYLPRGWIRVEEWINGQPNDFAFCGWDCVMREAARFPSEVIDAN